MYETKKIKREIYHIIIPMILENILQISASLITTAMVGRLLANDISAQGICVRITDTLWVFYKGVAIGATVLIAARLWCRKRKKLQKNYGADVADRISSRSACADFFIFPRGYFPRILFERSTNSDTCTKLYENCSDRIYRKCYNDSCYSSVPGIWKYKNTNVYCGSNE